MCNRIKCVSANQRNCLKKTILIHLLLQPDQAEPIAHC